MYISKVRIRNFRLLADVELALEQGSTVVVGRNNSGKTSLSEVVRRFLADPNPRFQIEDFSNQSYEGFCQALAGKNAGHPDDAIRALIPSIELRLHFTYDSAEPTPAALSEFVVDLDPNCNDAIAVARYALKDGAIDALFEGLPTAELASVERPVFFRTLRERIPALYRTVIFAEDPNNPTNRRSVSHSALRDLLDTGFVNAQRGLDDNTTTEADVLARVLEGLFSSAMSPMSSEAERQIVEDLQVAVQDIQERIDADFTGKLTNLLPTLATFGYPGLGGSALATETTLDAERLLKNHTKVRYAGHEGILLPEAYNGLGIRNLVFILLQVVSFYRRFRAAENAPGVHLVFIEEPEAHLHPQMQEVFIRQLSAVAQQLSDQDGADLPWPVQFLVSTHSSHIANEAGFESIRYFLATAGDDPGVPRRTTVKDVREGLRDTPEEHRAFLHQYLTLTRCDLFFADKAILVEGTSERLILPTMICKLDAAEPDGPKLSSQYITVLEVGGAYAHIFFELLDFLELRTLIITDIDTVVSPGGAACKVSEGTATSNACIRAWFEGEECTPTTLLAKTEQERILGLKQIAYQRPETDGGPCGRTFEDAFMLANQALFGISEGTLHEKEAKAADLLASVKKSAFALKYAIDEQVWATPAYIHDGLRWLASLDVNDGDGGMAPDGAEVGDNNG